MERLHGELGRLLQALRGVAPDPQRVDQMVATATVWRAWRGNAPVDEAGDQPAAYRRLLEGSSNPYDPRSTLFHAQQIAETQSDTAAEYQQSRQAIVVALLALVLIGLVAALVVARSITSAGAAA